jgi:hypothetical protein
LFVERTDEISYVNIMNEYENYGGCWSEFRYQGRAQNANLPGGCLYMVCVCFRVDKKLINFQTSTVVHIFMIALGFIQEQTRQVFNEVRTKYGLTVF